MYNYQNIVNIKSRKFFHFTVNTEQECVKSPSTTERTLLKCRSELGVHKTVWEMLSVEAERSEKD